MFLVILKQVRIKPTGLVFTLTQRNIWSFEADIEFIMRATNIIMVWSNSDWFHEAKNCPKCTSLNLNLLTNKKSLFGTLIKVAEKI